MKEYFHAWNLIFEGLPRPFWTLLKNCSNLKYAWENLNYKDLRKAGIRDIYLRNLSKLRDQIDPIEAFRAVERDGITVLTIRDAKYPPQLCDLNTHLPPAVLYVRGKIPCAPKLFLSIVGTRQMTGYGEAVTRQIVKKLQVYEPVVVSGMAWGIDSVAHAAALECKLQTIAVLGFGLNRIPQHLKQFANKIAQNGALISEYPPYTEGQKHHFPLRNRIISGLSKATIVVEAGEKSGACITAQYALDQSKEVFAVPGNLAYEKSKGTNRLIQKSSAHLLMEPEDILEILSIPRKKSIHIDSYTIDQQNILNALEKKQLSLGDLKRTSLLSAQKFNTALTELEILNVIRKNRGGNYFIT
jgi:DNA processing protein